MGHGHALLALFLQLALVAVVPPFVSAQGTVTQDSQCGGQNWPGPTTCGFHDQTCVFISQYLSQCLSPGDPRIPSSSQPPPPSTSASHPTHTETPTLTEHSATPTPSIPTTTSDPASLPTGSSDDTQSDEAVSPDSSSSPARSTGSGSPARFGEGGKGSSTASAGSSFTPANRPAVGPTDSAAGMYTPGASSLASDSSPSATAPPALGAAKSSNKAAIIAGVLVPLLLIGLGFVGVVLYKRRQRVRDRREWERTHAEIADAVRQVGGHGVTAAGTSPYVGSAWASSSHGLRQGSGDTVTDPFVDTYQDAEYAPAVGAAYSPAFAPAQSPFHAEDEPESPHSHAV